MQELIKANLDIYILILGTWDLGAQIQLYLFKQNYNVYFTMLQDFYFTSGQKKNHYILSIIKQR